VFFSGVATVVTKLFNIVMPHVAVFGEKDYQQLAVIRRMVQDLNMHVDIIGCPTVRETDGLAMSSRNAYLTAGNREAALSLYRSLTLAQGLVSKGVWESADIIKRASDLIGEYPENEIDYVAIVDAETLVDIPTVENPARMALAVKVSGTRLIDNMALNPPKASGQ
jgi:pantoate--beta-alanine ligase